MRRLFFLLVLGGDHASCTLVHHAPPRAQFTDGRAPAPQGCAGRAAPALVEPCAGRTSTMHSRAERNSSCCQDFCCSSSVCRTRPTTTTHRGDCSCGPLRPVPSTQAVPQLTASSVTLPTSSVPSKRPAAHCYHARQGQQRLDQGLHLELQMPPQQQLASAQPSGQDRLQQPWGQGRLQQLLVGAIAVIAAGRGTLVRSSGSNPMGDWPQT